MSGLVDFGTLTTFGRVFDIILANVGCESTVTSKATIVPWISVYFVRFCGGKSSWTMFGRAGNAKFVHRQLAPLARLRA